MDITNILDIQDAIVLSDNPAHLELSMINDPVWWNFAMSNNTKTYDKIIDGSPNYGVTLAAELLNLSPDQQTTLEQNNSSSSSSSSSSSELGPPNNRLKDLYAKLMDNNKVVPSENIDWLTAWNVDLVYLRKLINIFKQLNTPTINNAIETIQNQKLSTALITSHEDSDTARYTKMLDFTTLKARVSDYIYNTYKDSVYITHKAGSYEIRRMKNGQGVIIYKDNGIYGLTDITYNGTDKAKIAQPRPHKMDRFNARDARGSGNIDVICVVFKSTVRGTFSSVFAESGKIEKRLLFKNAIAAIDKYTDVLMHGSLHVDDILVTDANEVIFTHFKYCSHINDLNQEPTIKEWRAYRYTQGWDYACFISSAIERFGDNERTGIKFDKLWQSELSIVSKSMPHVISKAIVPPITQNIHYLFHFRVVYNNAIGAQYTIAIDTKHRRHLRLNLDAPPNTSFALYYCHNKYTVYTTNLSELNLKFGERISGGSFGEIYSLKTLSGDNSGYIAKVGEITESEYNIQRRASNMGFAPKIRAFFNLKVASVRQDSTSVAMESLPILIMEAMDETVEQYITHATVIDRMIVIHALYAKLEEFARSGFMHHDLKMDNVMIQYQRTPENERNTVVAPNVFIIDYGKAWYAGSDNRIPYGYYLSANNEFVEFEEYHNVVSWMNDAKPRNASKLYDRLCCSASLVLQLRDITSYARTKAEQKSMQDTCMPYVKTVFESKVVGMDDDTETKMITFDSLNPTVLFRYTEYPRIDRTTKERLNEAYWIWTVTEKKVRVVAQTEKDTDVADDDNASSSSSSSLSFSPTSMAALLESFKRKHADSPSSSSNRRQIDVSSSSSSFDYKQPDASSSSSSSFDYEQPDAPSFNRRYPVASGVDVMHEVFSSDIESNIHDFRST
mgnify:CR=1 FL=1